MSLFHRFNSPISALRVGLTQALGGMGRFTAIRNISKLSPLLFAVSGYVALALTLPIQELMVRGAVTPGSTFSQLAAGALFPVVILAPVAAFCQAAWFLSHRRRTAESISAIAIASPLLFLLLSAARRSMA